MMPVTRSLRKFKIAVYSVILLALSGCYDPYYVAGDGYQSSYGGTVVSYQQPWYDYDYYPSSGVYFNPGTGYYYHHDRGRWNHVRRLPRHIRIYDYDRVRMRLHGDRPYLYYDEHRRKYRGHRNKHKQRYRDDRYRDERKHERRYKREYKDQRKHDRHSGGKGKKRNKHESGRDDIDRSADRHRRNKEEKRRKTNDKQRKTLDNRQERENRRKATGRRINAIETGMYGGRGFDNSSRNSGWTIQK